MTYKQGKFYNESGEVVPLEFGNKEQLHIIEAIKDMIDGVMLPFTGPFRCPCGALIEYKFIEGKTIRCPDCSARYQFWLYKEELECIKLLKKSLRTIKPQKT